MTIENKHGFLALLPHLKTFAESVKNNIKTLAENAAAVEGWQLSKAEPVLLRLCDGPDDLIQPKTPALILTWQGITAISNSLLYNYDIKVSYVYSAPQENEWGDDPLYACALAAEAIHYTIKNFKQINGLNLIIENSYNVSEMMIGNDTIPILTRILTTDLTFQVEEDF